MDIFVIDDMYFWLFIYCIDYSLSPMKLAWTHTLMYLVFTCSFGWSVVSVWARLIEHCVVNVHIAVAWSDGWVGFASDLILGVPLFYNCDDTLRDDVFPRDFFQNPDSPCPQPPKPKMCSPSPIKVVPNQVPPQNLKSPCASPQNQKSCPQIS